MVSAVLTSGGSLYDLTVVSATVLRLVRKTGSVGPCTIGGIMAPAFTPSTGILVSTYVTVGSSVYTVDSITTPLVWSAACSLPCRTCSGIGCQSCYSDPLQVASRTILFLNSTLGACVS